jgi:hypothetical protein
MTGWFMILIIIFGIAFIACVTTVCILFIPKKNKEDLRKPIKRQVNERPKCPCQKNRSR